MTYQKFGLNCIRNQERTETNTPDNILTKGRYIMNNEFEKMSMAVMSTIITWKNKIPSKIT